MDLRLFYQRVRKFAPTTWYIMLLVAEAIWVSATWLPATVTSVMVLVATATYAWLKAQRYRRREPRVLFVANTAGDLVGPTAVWLAATGVNVWLAHAVALHILAVGTVTWVGLGHTTD